MAVEKMQFVMPMSSGCEVFPFIPSFQAEQEAFVRDRAAPAKEESFVRVRAEPEAAILKAKSKPGKEKASLKPKAKAKAEKEASFIGKAKAEKEEAFIGKAKAEKEEAFIGKATAEEVDKEEPALKAKAAKEEGIIEANYCCGSDEDDVPYDQLYHDSDTEEDPDKIMAKIVERWDSFMKEEEARFPDQTYRVYYPGEYTADDKEGSDDEEYYRRKIEEGVLV